MNLEVVLILAFAVLFVGFGCFTFWVLSRVSGWQELAERFQYGGQFSGSLYLFRSARLNVMHFRGALNVGMNEEGLYLVPTLLFRPFHRPMLIPWNDIRAENHKGLVFSHTAVRFPSCPGIDLVLYGRDLQNAARYYLASAQGPG